MKNTIKSVAVMVLPSLVMGFWADVAEFLQQVGGAFYGLH